MLPLIATLTGSYCWREEKPEIPSSERLACRGTPWIDDQPINDLDLCQRWLDGQRTDPRRLFALAGDFLLSYHAPQEAFCWLYRPLTAAHTFYYRLHDDALSWSTSIETLFPSSPTLADVEPALVSTLVCAGEYDPERTPYRGIYCLRAGQCLSISRTGHIQMVYDDFHWGDHSTLPFASAANLYRHYCTEAVRQAVFGFPQVGVFLSGGFDSAVLAHEAHTLGCKVEGFHWTWSQLPFFQQEQVAAQELANALSLPLHLVDGNASIEAGGNALQVLNHLPFPYNHSFFASFQQTASEARQRHLPLLLTGHLGDTLFESEERDGIREKVQQKRLLSACGDVLSRYSRQQAWQTLWGWLTTREAWQPLSGAGQRIMCCTWLTPEAREQAQTHGQYVYHPTQVPASASTARVYQAIMTGINAETARDAMRCQYALFPLGIAIKHPYLNRSLIEYCLSLGRMHRALFVAGEALSKPLARSAYLGRLPSSLVRREVRLPYAAVDEYYALQNREGL